MDAARLDYAGAFAYLSVRFNSSSDYIFLRICDGSGKPVALIFDSIPKYYDGRKGAVTVTLDDWSVNNDADFIAATDYLAGFGLSHTAMVITGIAPWQSIQGQIDKHGDLLEIGSHGATHACSAADYAERGYLAETVGSADAIRTNLSYYSHPYVAVFAEPCGYTDATLKSSITTGGYLLSRGLDYDSGFVAWDAGMGRYGRGGLVCDDYYDQDNQDLLNRANALFDKAMAADGIYHLLDHPWRGLWRDGSYLLQHLDHIQGRSDVWYAAYGQLYQYHALQEMRGNLTVRKVAQELIADFSASPLSGGVPLSVAFSDRSTGTIEGWLWEFGDGGTSLLQNPVHVYAAQGSYTVKLTASGPMGVAELTKGDYVTVTPPPPAEEEDYVVHVDGALHQKFGLYYPATYKFRVPSGASGLAAFIRYSDAASWSPLAEKKSGEIFNGVDAVRFDYQGGFAYLSARFDRSSDDIYLRVTDRSGQPVPMAFDSIPKYYDARAAAVTVSLDDWQVSTDADFLKATNDLAGFGVPHTVMVITDNAPWPSIQNQLNRLGDLIEIGSHGASHACTAAEYQKKGYLAEAVGSRDAIRTNLTYASHPYVPVYAEPCGFTNATLQSALTTGDYLLSRSTLYSDGFVAWNAGWGRYGRGGFVCDDYYDQDNADLLTRANGLFDKAMAGKKIYHLLDHPWRGLWRDGSYLLQHIGYIKGRSNVWYAAYGQLYQYHLLQQMRGNLTVRKVQP